MTSLTVELQEKQTNLHKDLLKQDEADVKVMKLFITGYEM
jgi:hypothetical protein